MRTPERGDVWIVNLNPTLGKEQQGLRPIMVVSEQAFNRLGLCVVCPITQGGQASRFAGFAVTLMGSGSETQGLVMCDQPRTIDLVARAGRLVENVDKHVLNEVLARLQTLFKKHCLSSDAFSVSPHAVQKTIDNYSKANNHHGTSPSTSEEQFC